jgi:PBP1b-binding outer membrane lipoprotein LpoB
MKIKYIFSMVAGLIVLVTTSCSEEKTTETDAGQSAPEKTAEVTTPVVTPATPETPAAPAVAVEAPSAYYVMFSGKG